MIYVIPLTNAKKYDKDLIVFHETATFNTNMNMDHVVRGKQQIIIIMKCHAKD